MVMRFSLAIFLCLGLLACNPGTVHVVRFPNGKIQQKWTEKSISGQGSLREGRFQSFHKNGMVESAIEYHDGKKNGLACFWSKDGKLRFEGKYQDNFLLKEKRFDESGRILFEQNYSILSRSTKVVAPSGDSLAVKEKCAWNTQADSKPIRHGLCELSYDDGKLLSTLYYQSGHLQGPFKTWYKNGKVWAEGNYDRDLQTSIWRSWMPSGKPLSSCTFQKGKREGLAQEWYPNGKLRLQSEFRQGEHYGPQIAWYPDGSKFYSSNFFAGKLNGDFYQWYPGGKLRLHCRFEKGKKEGLSRVWYRQGGMLEQAYFHAGNLDGSYRTWGPAGNPLASKEFRNGNVAYDSKAKEILELLGADQVRVPVGLLGFYWGMSLSDCEANLLLLQAQEIRPGPNELTASLNTFPERKPTLGRIRLQFNSQAELWGINLDILQKNSTDYFLISEKLENEIGSDLGRADLHKGEDKKNTNQTYSMTRKKSWGQFTVTMAKENDTTAAISQEMAVVSALTFSPAQQGWFRFSLANFLYREYARSENIEISPPRWPQEAFLAGR